MEKKHAERWVNQILADKLRSQRRQAKEKLRPIAEKKRRGEKLSKRDIEEAMKLLCYNHFCFCCSLKKRCGYRDSLLRILGLTKRDYVEYKRRCKELFWLMLVEKTVI